MTARPDDRRARTALRATRTRTRPSPLAEALVPAQRPSSLDRDLDLFRGIPASVRQSPWRTAAWTGAGAAIVGAAVGVAVAVACWLPNAGASGPPMSAIRAGTLAFLAAQHGGVDLDGTRVGFVPLGMTAIVAVVVWRASSVLADVLERLRMTSRRDLAKAGTVQAGGYAATCAALAVIGRLGTTSVPPIPVAVGAFAVCGIVTAASLAWTSICRRWSVLSAPDYFRPGLRAATGAICVYVGAGEFARRGLAGCPCRSGHPTVPNGGWRDVRHPAPRPWCVVRA